MEQGAISANEAAEKTMKKLHGNPSVATIKFSPKSPCVAMRYILPKIYRSENVNPNCDFGRCICFEIFI